LIHRCLELSERSAVASIACRPAQDVFEFRLRPTMVAAKNQVILLNLDVTDHAIKNSISKPQPYRCRLVRGISVPPLAAFLPR
jgi:hypothetical protein